VLGEEAGAAEEADRRPDVLLIGAPKCGTTSLMACLSQHPQLWCQPRKELHFFNNRWEWGLPWYREQFPSRRALAGRLRLEATPDYLQAPEIPARVAATLPGVKLIVVLREPLARALSWYHHQRRWAGLEGGAEAVIGRELQELEALPAAQLQGLGWRAPNCLAGSLYDSQFRLWRRQFPATDLLILSFERLCSHPASTLNTLYQFLNVSPAIGCQDRPFPALNCAARAYPALEPALAQRCRHTVLRNAHRLWSQL
jgi:hypothetical protein